MPVYAYLLQWRDLKTGKTKTETCGTDYAFAQSKATERRKELASGQFIGITPIK